MKARSTGKSGEGAEGPSTSSAPVDATGNPARRPSTEGQRRLLEVPASLSVIAKAVGCSKALAGYWRTGKKVPSVALRTRLSEVYGIPPATWELAPGAALEPGETAPEPAPELDDDADTLALTNASLAAIRKALRSTDLSETARSKKEDTYAKLLALKARLERDDDEDRFVRGPKWRAFRDRLIEILRPFPEAARAAAEALQELDG